MNDDDREDDGTPDATPLVVGAGARFEGLLTFWGCARVEGAVRGEVAADGLLEVGPQAVLAARIEVDTLVVEGLVEGDVVARERVEIRAGGRIRADVATPRLVIAEGGALEGQLVMRARPGVADAVVSAA